MHRVVLPFKLGSNKNVKSVSEIQFTVDSNVQTYSSIQISQLKFMKLYDEEKFNLSQYPVDEYWGDVALGVTTTRAAASVSSGVPFRGVPMGHAYNNELVALDEMPHTIELSIEGLNHRNDSRTLVRDSLGEYQSTDTSKQRILDDNNKIQTMLIYSPDLLLNGGGKYVGSIACSMNNIGSFNIRNKGFSDTFKIKMSMYNFRGLALSHTPDVELTLQFR